jgi:hypothetical protein
VSDRELLEMAAKAAGLTTSHKWNAERMDMVPPVFAMVVHRDGELVSTGWNPLTDDDDALRLAVKLGIDITFEAFGSVMAGKDAPALGFWCACEDIGSDVYAATRRAIVRAAAEIGRSM